MQKKTILVVDEDPRYFQIVQRALGNGFCCVFCQSANEALTAFRGKFGQFDLVIAAYKLGKGMDGIRLLRIIREESPGQPIIFLSGSQPMNLQARIAGFPVLKKPFKTVRFKKLVHEVFER